jgi:hypothetical protein
MTIASNTSTDKLRNWLKESGGGLVADAVKATKVDRSSCTTILRMLAQEGLCRFEKRTAFESGQNRTKNYYTYVSPTAFPTSLLVGEDAARVRAFLKHCPEARSDYREFAGYIDFEAPTNVKKLPEAKRKGLKISVMGVLDRAA